VTKIRKSLERDTDDYEFPTVLSNASRILAAWHQDKEFIDAKGEPRLLPLEAPNDQPSFARLTKKYAGDIPLTAMLKELKKTNAIEVQDDDQYKVLTRFFVPNKYDSNKIFSLAETFNDIGETSYHNFVRDDEDVSRLQARAFNNHVPEELANEFGEMVRTKSYELLEEIDNWLTKNEITKSEMDNKKPARLGLGVYLIQGSPTETLINEEQK